MLYQLIEVIRISTLLLEPFIPSIRSKVWQQLGLNNLASVVIEKLEGVIAIKMLGLTGGNHCFQDWI